MAAGVFMLPGDSQDRTRRTIRAILSVQNVDCGGEPLSDLDRTSYRQDQARYPQLSLIAIKGFSEELDPDPDDSARVELDDSCAARSLPRVYEWDALMYEWVDATDKALASPEMSPVLDEAARCLASDSGWDIAASDPAVAYLQKVDNEAAVATPSQMEALAQQRAATYVKCMARYEQDMAAALEPAKTALVDKHADLLNEMAQDLAAAGYVP